MTTIENYYKGMIKDGTWMKPDPGHKTIVALKAQHLSQKKGEPKEAGRKDNKWKTIPLKKGESGEKVVTINGKKVTYWHHNRYTIHKPQEYRKKQEDKKSEED